MVMEKVMRYHKCPGCRKVFKVEVGLLTVTCSFCDHRSTVPVDSDTPLPHSLRPLNAQASMELDIEPEIRRHELRYSTTATALCTPIGARDGEDFRAKIVGMSDTSIELLLYRRFERTTLLRIEIEVAGGESLASFMARVILAKQLGVEEWLLECAFCSHMDDGLSREIQTLVQDNMVPLSPESRSIHPPAGDATAAAEAQRNDRQLWTYR